MKSRYRSREHACSLKVPYTAEPVAQTAAPPVLKPKVVYPSFPSWEAHFEQMRKPS